MCHLRYFFLCGFHSQFGHCLIIQVIMAGSKWLLVAFGRSVAIRLAMEKKTVDVIFFLGADCALVPVWRFLPPFPAAWGESRSFRIHTYCIFASLPTLIALLVPRRTSSWPVWLDWGWQWGLESGEGCQPLWRHGQGFLTSHLYFIIIKQMPMNNSWAKH